jgi:aminocarboxymuconate-semialdehyde decarboxylase
MRGRGVQASEEAWMTLTDVHTHVVPETLLRGSVEGGRVPTLSVSGGRGVVVAGGRERPVPATMWQLARRLDELDALGIGHQVISLFPPLLNPPTVGPDSARVFAQMNDWIADAARSHPGRLTGLGALPVWDLQAALAELQRVRELGLLGVEIGTHHDGIPVSDERYRPLLDRAEELGLLVFLHGTGPGMRGELPADSALSITVPLDMGFVLAALIANGTLRDLPRLRLCAAHGGGSLAFTLPRFEQSWRRRPELQDRLPLPPTEYARRIHYDTMVFDAAALAHLVATFGAGQVLLGSDYPVLPAQDSVALLNLAGGQEPWRTMVGHGNAASLLGHHPVPGRPEGGRDANATLTTDGV